jgi:hypothetical protein
MKNKYKNTPFLERGIIPTSTRTPEKLSSENEFSFGVRAIVRFSSQPNENCRAATLPERSEID